MLKYMNHMMCVCIFVISACGAPAKQQVKEPSPASKKAFHAGSDQRIPVKKPVSRKKNQPKKSKRLYGTIKKRTSPNTKASTGKGALTSGSSPSTVRNPHIEKPERFKPTDRSTDVFKMNIPDGFSIYEFPDGRKYLGEWRSGMMDGHGTMYYPDGRKYVGSWKAGKTEGYGELTSPDGRTYSGQWSGGMIHGKGILTYPDGRTRSGNWESGNFVRDR